MNTLRNGNGVTVVPRQELSSHIDLTKPQKKALKQHARAVETIMTTNALRHVEGTELDWTLIDQFNNAESVSEKVSIFRNPLVSSALLGFHLHKDTSEDLRPEYTKFLSFEYRTDWRIKEKRDRLYHSDARIWIGKAALGTIQLSDDPWHTGTLVERKTFVALGKDGATPRPIDMKQVFGQAVRHDLDEREIVVVPMTTSYYAHKAPLSS